MVYRATTRVLAEETKALYPRKVEAKDPLWPALLAKDWAKVKAALEEQLGVEAPAPRASEDKAVLIGAGC